MGNLLREGWEYGGGDSSGTPDFWFIKNGQAITTFNGFVGGIVSPKDINGNGGEYFLNAGTGYRLLKRPAREAWIAFRAHAVGASGSPAIYLSNDLAGTFHGGWQKHTSDAVNAIGAGSTILATSGGGVFTPGDGWRDWQARVIVDGSAGEVDIIKDRNFGISPLLSATGDTDIGATGLASTLYVSAISDRCVFDDIRVNDATLLVDHSSGTITVGETLTADVSGTECVVTAIIDGDPDSGEAVIQVHAVNVGGTSPTPTRWNSPNVDPWASDTTLTGDGGGSWVAVLPGGQTTFKARHSGPPVHSFIFGARIEADIDFARDTLQQAGTRNPDTNVAAEGTLSLAGQPDNNDQTEVGGQAYTYETVFSDTVNFVLIGATVNDTIDNLIAGIINGAGEGTTYGTGTIANALVTAVNAGGDTMTATALNEGVLGNGITSTNPTNVSGNLSWDAATLGATTIGVGGSFAYFPPWDDSLIDAAADASFLEGDSSGERYIGELEDNTSRSIPSSDIKSIQSVSGSVRWGKEGVGIDTGIVIFESGGTEYPSEDKGLPTSPDDTTFDIDEIPDSVTPSLRKEGFGTDLNLAALQALRMGVEFKT